VTNRLFCSLFSLSTSRIIRITRKIGLIWVKPVYFLGWTADEFVPMASKNFRLLEFLYTPFPRLLCIKRASHSSGVAVYEYGVLGGAERYGYVNGYKLNCVYTFLFFATTSIGSFGRLEFYPAQPQPVHKYLCHMWQLGGTLLDQFNYHVLPHPLYNVFWVFRELCASL
jgi:hypothetical protein